MTTDTLGVITDVNRQTCEITGYAREELIGSPFKQYFTDPQRAEEGVRLVLGEDRVTNYELTIRARDGRETVVSYNATTFRDADGRLRGVFAAARDITAQKSLEERIRRQNAELTEATAFLNNVLESSTEYSIIAMDLEGRILNWNAGARRNYGYSAEDMVGKRNARILYTPEDLGVGKVDAFMDTALRSGKAEAVFERVREDGRRFTASVALSLRRGAAGTPIGFVLISKDITDQKRLEEQLRRQNEELEEQNRRVQEANRLKSEFLANMSHELRTPLNAIIGFSELLHDGRAGAVNTKQKSYVGDVLTSARHLLQLINDVLDLSKVESGKMEFFPEPVDPTRLMTEVRDILRTLTARKRIRLHSEIDPALGQVVLDPAKLKQVLFNYLSNALKFTPEEGQVTLRMRAVGTEDLVVEVEDTGIGIRPEDIPRLFVEFEQLDASASKKYQGTGLGLALTKRIVEAQGGRVGVTNTPGKGSIFSAILPRIDHAHMPDVAPQPKKEPQAGAYTVLVIEDAPRDREWLVNTLEAAGYGVESAATGIEALRFLNERQFDAITLDLMLPDMSGWEVLRQARADGLNRTVPVVVVTVLADAGSGVGFAIHDFLEKPVEQHDLLAALELARIRAAKGMTILLVDNNRRELKLYQSALEQNGYTTKAKSNAAAALRVAAENPPDVVVLDLVMPQMDGFEFLRRFRAAEHGRRTPVIVLTAKDLVKEQQDLLTAMAEGIVAKGDGSVRALLAEISMALVQYGAIPEIAVAANGGPFEQSR
jgi:PAS domain S-box-containing protein